MNVKNVQVAHNPMLIKKIARTEELNAQRLVRLQHSKRTSYLSKVCLGRHTCMFILQKGSRAAIFFYMYSFTHTSFESTDVSTLFDEVTALKPGLY